MASTPTPTGETETIDANNKSGSSAGPCAALVVRAPVGVRERRRSRGGQARAGRRRRAGRPRRPVHRARVLQPAVADSGPAVHARRRAGRRGVLPGARRARAGRARAAGAAVRTHQRLPADQQRGRRPARAGRRRLRRHGGRADHDAGDLGQPEPDLRRAGGRAGRDDDLRDRAGVLRRAGRVRRRIARRARSVALDGRSARGRHRAGRRAAVRAEDRHVHRPARDAGAGRRAGARRAGAGSVRLRGRLLAGGGARWRERR